MRILRYSLALAFVIVRSTVAFADPEERQDAIDKYKNANSDVSDSPAILDELYFEQPWS